MPAQTTIACSLTPPELRDRERTVLAALRANIRQVEPRPDGYALDLAVTDEAIAAAAAVIEVERRCCPFLRFTLVVEPENGPIRLMLTGSPAVREFLAPWVEPTE